MRVAGQMAAETLLLVGEKLRAGMTTDDINTLVHEDTLQTRRAPGAAELPRLPEERVHVDQRGRLPRHPRRAACSRTATSSTSTSPRYLRTASTATRRPRSTSARRAPRRARSPRSRAARSSSASPRSARARASATSARRSRSTPRAQGCCVVRDFVGHGIGRSFHEAPQVKHYGKRGTGERLKAGHDLHHRADDQPRRLRGRDRSSTTSGRSRPPTARSRRSSSTRSSSRRPASRCSRSARSRSASARTSRPIFA